MPAHNNSRFQQYVDTCGSTYAAIVFVANQAKRLCIGLDNCISHAEALSWLLSGEKPEGLEHSYEIAQKRKNCAIDYARDMLLYVNDSEVRQAVDDTLSHSKRYTHLIYKYNNVRDESRQARIRVLSRMLRDEMTLIEIENDIL